MDPVVASGLTKARLLELVPKDLVGACDAAKLPALFTVAIFRKRPVRGGFLQRALRRLRTPAGEPLVLVGLDFTLEALDVAKAHRALVVATHIFGWTEAGYDEIHTTIATGKKRPVPKREV
jgi:hypothetical protein